LGQKSKRTIAAAVGDDEHLPLRLLLELQQREMEANGRGDTRAGARTLMRNRGADRRRGGTPREHLIFIFSTPYFSPSPPKFPNLVLLPCGSAAKTNGEEVSVMNTVLELTLLS
jgi:hypothetical protein